MDGQTSSVFEILKALNNRQKFLVVIGLGVILLVVGGAVLYQILKPSASEQELDRAAEHIDITNFNEYASDMPEFYKKQVEATIYNTLVDYNGVSADISASAEIRKDSYKAEDNGYDGAKAKDSSFIVDIPSLEESFTLSFSWVPGDNNPSEYDVIIGCPSYMDWIYPGKTCAISNNPMDALEQYLPDEFEVDGKKIMLSSEIYGKYSGRSGEKYLAVDIEGCDNDNSLQAAKKAVESWVEKRMVDPAHIYIEYGFASAICDEY